MSLDCPLPFLYTSAVLAISAPRVSVRVETLYAGTFASPARRTLSSRPCRRAFAALAWRGGPTAVVDLRRLPMRLASSATLPATPGDTAQTALQCRPLPPLATLRHPGLARLTQAGPLRHSHHGEHPGRRHSRQSGRGTLSHLPGTSNQRSR